MIPPIVVCFFKNEHRTIYLCMWSHWNGKDDVKIIEYLFSVCFRVLSEVPISLWLVKFGTGRLQSLSYLCWSDARLSFISLCQDTEFLACREIRCVNGSFFQIKFQDSCLYFDFTALPTSCWNTFDQAQKWSFKNDSLQDLLESLTRNERSQTRIYIV